MTYTRTKAYPHPHTLRAELNNVSTYITEDASSTKIFYMDNWREIPGHEGLDEPKYTVAMTLKALIPQAKIIIIMRNPVDRYV
jgi:hypothetical protein